MVAGSWWCEGSPGSAAEKEIVVSPPRPQLWSSIVSLLWVVAALMVPSVGAMPVCTVRAVYLTSVDLLSCGRCDRACLLLASRAHRLRRMRQRCK